METLKRCPWCGAPDEQLQPVSMRNRRGVRCLLCNRIVLDEHDECRGNAWQSLPRRSEKARELAAEIRRQPLAYIKSVPAWQDWKNDIAARVESLCEAEPSPEAVRVAREVLARNDEYIDYYTEARLLAREVLKGSGAVTNVKSKDRALTTEEHIELAAELKGKTDCPECHGAGYTVDVYGGPQDGEWSECAEQIPCSLCSGDAPPVQEVAPPAPAEIAKRMLGLIACNEGCEWVDEWDHIGLEIGELRSLCNAVLNRVTSAPAEVWVEIRNRVGALDIRLHADAPEQRDGWYALRYRVHGAPGGECEKLRAEIKEHASVAAGNLKRAERATNESRERLVRLQVAEQERDMWKARAEKAERERDEARLSYDNMDRERNICFEACKKVEAERDEAVARAKRYLRACKTVHRRWKYIRDFDNQLGPPDMVIEVKQASSSLGPEMVDANMEDGEPGWMVGANIKLSPSEPETRLSRAEKRLDALYERLSRVSGPAPRNPMRELPTIEELPNHIAMIWNTLRIIAGLED